MTAAAFRNGADLHRLGGVPTPSRRRVDGFTARIETGLTEHELRRSLAEMAARSAFQLEAVLADQDGGEASDSRCFRATFSLDAPNGATGDAQIFVLLREIACEHRWTGVQKRMTCTAVPALVDGEGYLADR